MKLISYVLLAACSCIAVTAENAKDSDFLEKHVECGGINRAFRVFLPPDYTVERKWPVILFLHGGGAEGTDNIKQAKRGIGEALRRDTSEYPAIVVFPQVRTDMRWTGPEAEYALAALDAVLQEYSCDRHRIYLTGQSRGGNGTWYIAYRHANRFAAIVPVCGRVLPKTTRGGGRKFIEASPVVPSSDGAPFAALARRLKDKPIWIFHGDADPVVPVDESRGIFSELQKLGSRARYSELSGVRHNSWKPAYGNAEFRSWLFQQRLPNTDKRNKTAIKK